MKKISILILILLLSNSIFAQGGAYQKETAEQKQKRMAWYSEAKFGMFIHWGAYSVLDGEYKGKKQKDPKGEWIMNHLKISIDDYKKDVVGNFNPSSFDAELWAKTAKEAGMKYMVMTTKHHDGFALFNSKTSDYNIVSATPFGRDVIKELSDACRKEGLKFGIYYSQAQDWYQPGGYKPNSRWDKKQDGDWDNYFKTIVKGQVSELLTNYGEISLLWWDSGRTAQNKDLADEIGSELVKLQPNIIVNPRLGGKLKGDFQTHEQVIPSVFEKEYNELCLTHNRSWSYRKSDTTWKSPDFLLQTLVKMTSLGANFLFNVGPNSEGEFPEQTTMALKYIGNWMNKNSDAIYGTQKSPFYKLDWGVATHKNIDGKEYLYLHVFDWSKDGKLNIPGLHNVIEKAYLLANNKKLKAKTTKEGILLEKLPAKAPHDAVSVIVLELKGKLNVDAGYIKSNKNGDFILNPSRALLTVKPQFSYIPQIVGQGVDEYFDNWRNKFEHPRFKNTATKAHWKIDCPSSENYKLIGVFSTQTDKNIVSLQGGKKVFTSLPNTGGMDKFQEVELGEMKLKAGINTITFTGGKKPQIWDYVRLKTIKLIKIK